MPKNNKNSVGAPASAEDIADVMARYMIAGLPMPDSLYDQLIEVVCEDLEKERKGSKPSSNKKAVA